jgi:cytochrome oxidase Cu insertion factor (SCO1/SenC/PrrC family)
MTIQQQARKVGWLVYGGLVLVVATILLAFMLATLKFRAAVGKPLPVLGAVQNFTLTNENGRAVSLTGLRGRVWLADIIFTRCPGQCLRMSANMKQLQQALPATSQARLISLTTDPDYDTPPILKAYAQRFDADPARWIFLTGPKSELAKLAIDSLKLTVVEKKPEERDNPQDLFVHSTIFVVVDKRGQLRGTFNTAGEGADFDKVKPEILSAIRRLELER